MRTSSKIIALIGATQSNAFFTEFFSSKAEEPQAQAKVGQDSFSETLYSAQDWVYSHWYDGEATPIYYHGSNQGELTGPYGGAAYGYYTYTVEGYEWYYDDVYAYAVEGYQVSFLHGTYDGWYYTAFDDYVGWYGWIYAEAYDYGYGAWMLDQYKGIYGSTAYGVYAADYDVSTNFAYYLTYHHAGWLYLAYYTQGIDLYGEYDELMKMYYEGEEKVYEAFAYLYFAYATGAGYGDYEFYDYYGYYSGEYNGYQLDGPYYFEYGWGYFVYGDFVAYSWWWAAYGYFWFSDSDEAGVLFEYYMGYGAVIYEWYTGDAAWIYGDFHAMAGYGYEWGGDYAWFYSYEGLYDTGIYHDGSVLSGDLAGAFIVYGGDDMDVDDWLVDPTYPWVY